MNRSEKQNANKVADSVQQRLTGYACELNYGGLSSEAIHAAKVRVIDAFGVLIGGFYGDPCRIARNLVAEMPDPEGATVIGTRMKTTPDMAAFVNGITARYPELTDAYHEPRSAHGHASDTLMPVFTAAEYAQASGRDLITSVVLAYEVYLRISDIFHNKGFDHTTFCCLAAAVGAGKLLRLSSAQLSHCISMAVVPNNVLAQARTGHLSMFKAVAEGHADRAALFAALLAQAGMEGPHLPFEGQAGWCDHVVLERFTLNRMGGHGTPFKILDTIIKNRPSMGIAISSILAAEKAAPIKCADVAQVTLEIYKRALLGGGTGEHQWNPESRETADHSLPYLVAATLIDGTVTLRSFNDAHLWNPELRALMQKIKVVENEAYTRANEQSLVEHRARVTVTTSTGEQLVGETGGDADDLSTPKSDAYIEEKFRGLTEDVLGAKRVTAVLDRLWHLEDMKNVAVIPSDFVIV